MQNLSPIATVLKQHYIIRVFGIPAYYSCVILSAACL